jgi:hypothetical protein
MGDGEGDFSYIWKCKLWAQLLFGYIFIFSIADFFSPLFEIMIQLSTLDGISQLVLPVLQEDSRPSSQFALNQGNTTV